MPTFRIDPLKIKGKQIIIEGDMAHHIVQVLRYRCDDSLHLTDGAGGTWNATIATTGRQALTATLGDKIASAPMPLDITLAASILPKERWRILIEKAVELGVSRIQPLIATRTVMQSLKTAMGKRNKWEALSHAAAEQSNRAWYPAVIAPIMQGELSHRFGDYDHVFCCCETSLHRECTAPTMPERGQRCLLLVGPEGGWTFEEMALIQKRQAELIALGPNTLRTETAVAAALTLLQHHLW